MKLIRLFLFALVLAGCSTPRQPATVKPLPPAPIVATNPLLPPGFVPGTKAPTLSIMSRAEPETVIQPSLATISFLPGYLNLAWDESSSPEVDAYAIYYGDAPRHYTNEIILGNVTNCTLANLVVGEAYYIAATAICTADGRESDYSDELSVARLWQVAEISFGPDDTNAVLESSPDLFTWAQRGDSRHTTNNTWRVKLYDELPAEFFRSATYGPATLP